MSALRSLAPAPPVADASAQLTALRLRVAELDMARAEAEAFSAAVAHDLRTPLSAMDGFCSLLGDSLAELPDQPARSACEQYLERVRAGLGHMGELVEALQRLSRVSTVALHLETVDLSALAQEVLDGLAARDRGRAHHGQVQPGLLARGDRALLRQLLENLMGNAWKFSAGQPQVHIEFGQVPGGAFYVRDQGAGFDMGHAHRLFQPFARLHSSSQFPGTGIGLATVRRIVQRHGGQVRAEGQVGAGASFFFTLAA